MVKRQDNAPALTESDPSALPKGSSEECPSSSSPDLESSQTHVDLGDDLLRDGISPQVEEESREESAQPESSEPSPMTTVEELLRGARVFLSEGFRDDARKILHRILFQDPRNGPARFMLKEIQEYEIGQLLSGDGSSPPVKLRPIGAEKEREQALSRSLTLNFDASGILKMLERDLSSGPAAEEDLTTPEQVESFCREIEGALGGASPRDRIDLAVAFLEIDRPELAIRLLKVARDALSLQVELLADSGELVGQTGFELLLSSTALLAQAFVVAGRGLEAAWLLHEVIRDMRIPSERKLDFMYWLGRAYESLGQREGAIRWYLKLGDVAADYRDIRDRLKVLGSGAQSQP